MVNSAKSKTITFDDKTVELLRSKGKTPVVIVEMLKQVNISLSFKDKQAARQFFDALPEAPME